MFGAFLILLREGFEAALIIGIILAVLVRAGEQAYVRHALYGIGVAVAASVLFALLAGGISDLFDGAGQEVLNGAVLMVAAAMITYVIVWLKESRKGLERQLAGEVHRRIASRGLGIFVLAFVAVFREGVESVLFLWGVLARGGDSVNEVFIGGLLGLVMAVGIAWLLFQGGRRIPMGMFFSVTTWLLVLLAAGMLAHGIGYWVAVDWLPALIYTVWDTGGLLPDGSGVGAVLAVLIGYNANPSLMEALIYFGYLGGVTAWIILSERPGTAEPTSSTP